MSIFTVLLLFLIFHMSKYKGFPCSSDSKVSMYNVGDLGFLDQEDILEKEMAIHSSILALRIPWTEEPGGLQSAGSWRVSHDWVTNTRHRKIKWFAFLLFNGSVRNKTKEAWILISFVFHYSSMKEISLIFLLPAIFKELIFLLVRRVVWKWDGSFEQMI